MIKEYKTIKEIASPLMVVEHVKLLKKSPVLLC